jgi:predicted acetyltransferase
LAQPRHRDLPDGGLHRRRRARHRHPSVLSLRLRPPRLEDEAAIAAAQAELAAEGFEFAFSFDDRRFADFVADLDDHRYERNVTGGRVPSTWLVAVVGGEVVGRSSIRFVLNDSLRHNGGHIGYAVRPAFRRRGHATEILRQSLVIARAGGVDAVLVTCDDDNVGSASVIERCGGVLEGVVADPRRPAFRRYWIG